MNRSLKLTQPLIDAFAENDLFRIMSAKEIGGGEADPDTIIDVLTECTYADGSAGWNLVVNTVTLSATAFIEPAKAREMLAHPRASAGGSGNPWPGIAHIEKGGYSVSGKYRLGSGTSHSSHIIGGAMVHRDGKQLVNEQGVPQVCAYFVPRDNVIFDDDWDVLGLSGSGSFDYEVKEQFVEQGWCWDVFNPSPVPRSGGNLFLLGTYGLASFGFIGLSLGSARRALDEIVQIVNDGRTRAGQAVPLRDQQTFQREFGKLSQAARAAELLARESFHRAYAHFDRGNPLTPKVLEDIRAATVYITQIAEEIVTFAFKAAGSKGFRNPSKLQRVFRDLMTGARHVSVDEISYDKWTKLKFAEANEQKLSA
jgi:alkylation response protein AidB-like acyl-CoA dehydrogenase